MSVALREYLWYHLIKNIYIYEFSHHDIKFGYIYLVCQWPYQERSTTSPDVDNLQMPKSIYIFFYEKDTIIKNTALTTIRP
jgi:hypothetical protein